MLMAYAAYILLLGPFLALDGHGVINSIPERARDAAYLPAIPFYVTPGLRTVYGSYLNLWYTDPIDADLPTGWESEIGFP